jgi:hypothetical protein
MPSMGLNQLEDSNLIVYRKFRWILDIPDVCNENLDSQTNALPPLRAARPSLSFKEMEAQHLNETIYFPGKPEWKPLNVTLYSVHKKTNPVFKYIKNIYKPNEGNYNLPNENNPKKYIIPKITLKMLGGNGCICETWVYEDCWFQSIDFLDLDMSASDFCSIDLTIRYARAYIE